MSAVPDRILSNFSFIDDTHRRLLHAMVYFMDLQIGQVSLLSLTRIRIGTWNMYAHLAPFVRIV